MIKVVDQMVSQNCVDSSEKFEVETVNRSWLLPAAILCSTLAHAGVFLTVNQLIPKPDLLSAYKPTISIELVSANYGRVKNKMPGTQSPGTISLLQQRKPEKFVAKTNLEKNNKSSDSKNVKKGAYKPLIQSKLLKARKTKVAKSSKLKYHQSNYRHKKTVRDGTIQTRRAKVSSNNGNRPPMFRIGSANNPRPPYPYLARKRGWQGRVVLQVSISKQGYAVNVKVKKASGHPILDRTAKATIEKWKFEPSLNAGQKVAAVIPVPINFVLHD